MRNGKVDMAPGDGRRARREEEPSCKFNVIENVEWP